MHLLIHDFLINPYNLIQSQILQSNDDEYMSFISFTQNLISSSFFSLFCKHQILCERLRLTSIYHHCFEEFVALNLILWTKEEIMNYKMHVIRKKNGSPKLFFKNNLMFLIIISKIYLNECKFN